MLELQVRTYILGLKQTSMKFKLDGACKVIEASIN